MTKQEEEKVIARANAAHEQRLSGAKGVADIDVFSNSGEVNTKEIEKPVAPSQTTLIDADIQQANKENAIDKLLKSRIEANNAEQQKLEENYQAQQKRQKRNAIISSIADGLSALSNMYFTSKGAPTPTATAPSMSEQQAKANVADRNTYLELLQGWRKRNNELLGNYATYQATAAKNKMKQQQLAIEQDREARLYIKDKAKQAYDQKLLELKDAKMTNDEKYRQAQLAYKYAELEAREEIAKMQDATANRRIDVQAAPVVKKTKGQVVDGDFIPEETRIEREGL